MLVWSKEFLDIQATIERGFILECVRDMIRTHSQMHRTDMYSKRSSIFLPIWLNGWVFVYELIGFELESRCSHLNFRYRACFKPEISWYLVNYRVWIHSKTGKWHKKNTQSVAYITQFSSLFVKRTVSCKYKCRKKN